MMRSRVFTVETGGMEELLKGFVKNDTYPNIMLLLFLATVRVLCHIRLSHE
jgi:hypothetical protein